MGKEPEGYGDAVSTVNPASIYQGQIEHLHKHADRALDFVEAHGDVSFTPQEERAVVRKIDRVLMPLVR